MANPAETPPDEVETEADDVGTEDVETRPERPSRLANSMLIIVLATILGVLGLALIGFGQLYSIVPLALSLVLAHWASSRIKRSTEGQQHGS